MKEREGGGRGGERRNERGQKKGSRGIVCGK